MPTQHMLSCWNAAQHQPISTLINIDWPYYYYNIILFFILLFIMIILFCVEKMFHGIYEFLLFIEEKFNTYFDSIRFRIWNLTVATA